MKRIATIFLLGLSKVPKMRPIAYPRATISNNPEARGIYLENKKIVDLTTFLAYLEFTWKIKKYKKSDKKVDF
ncbi:hypothetical protein RLL66_04235 [Streptococcus pneumoniae]|nr:hypothetical protein [Streptococcus pneumoniae]